MPKKALSGCTIALFGRNPNWSGTEQSTKVSGWLSHLSGRLESKFSSSTTHLIVSKKRWTEEPRPAILEDALKAKAGGRDLKILTFEWLEDCLNSQSRKRETPYEWEKRDAASKGKKGGARSMPGIMREVFEEATEGFVDELEKRKLEKRLEKEREKEREVKKAIELEEREAKTKRKKEQMRIFGQGAKKARNELLSNSHHIYQDNTGFKYDVLVTKVDARANRNERWAITIQLYESNALPHTYATNAQFGGSSIAPANTLICAIGTPFPTALHCFKTEFLERTGVDWDARISSHIKRLRDQKVEQGVGTGSLEGSMRGRPVSDGEAARAKVPFEQQKFAYVPPGYGPQGDLTEEERQRLDKLGWKVKGKNTEVAGERRERPIMIKEVEEGGKTGASREDIETWRKGVGADGDQQQPKPVALDDNDNDFEEMIEEEAGYPFEKELPATTGDAGVAATQADIEDIFAFPNQDAPSYNATRLDSGGDGFQPHHDTGGLATDTDGENADAAANQVTTGTVDAGNGIDWNATLENMVNDPAWLDQELAGMDLPQPDAGQDKIQQLQQDQEPSSLQPEVPSFATHLDTNEDLFQHGSQELGETLVAERAGGELLEEFGDGAPSTPVVDEQQQPTPPVSQTKKSAGLGLGGKLFGGLNLGSSILGKRKDVPNAAGEVEQGKEKVLKNVEDGGLAA